ncbi:MAG: DEAD/DEAH box helicase family protein [Defluviitaleaceae bacterium]|nr:DEAD/DEAH box helicase family protein [Defluviitaleaceae bacterium]MCL2275462.1 DEAD/DEAH box helicase family protein [Defluviitaleaceae bacterium]
MLPAAKQLQENAVTRLIECTQKEITFKSPTGSGKTYMMADMMHQILSQDSDVIFLVSTLSKGELAKQNYEKFIEYAERGLFKNLLPYLISSEVTSEERLYVPTNYNVYLLPRDLYKKGGRLMQGAMDNFLQHLTWHERIKGQGKKVYLIKDECHIATNNLDTLSEAYFSKIYNFSATPKLSRGQYPDVEITNENAVTAKLIKEVKIITDDNVTVGDAIQTFQEVKKQYRNLLGVNPCLIIQISNKDKADNELQKIYRELDKTQNADLKWMLIVNDNKHCKTNDDLGKRTTSISKWKEYAKDSASLVDIIIFKMVITEGWDIPRACMLYQMRDSKSKQLDEQVMGRVRRNPRLMDFETLSQEAQDLAMTAWVWGIVPDEMKKSFRVKLWQDSDIITNEIKIKTTRLKTLIEKPSFNIASFLTTLPPISAPTGIFKLYGNYLKAEAHIQEMGANYATNYHNWQTFTEHIEAISNESKRFTCNYENSMELVTNKNDEAAEVSFAPDSFYVDNGNYMNITDWIWKRSDGRDRFSFDSEAEQQWAEILKDLVKDENSNDERIGKRVTVGIKNPAHINITNETVDDFIGETKKIYLWGKNYVHNSPIRFEYYLNAIHSSYPDFVMKDSYNRIHIFEVKSVNASSSMAGGVDGPSYEAKLNELKSAYRQASKLTEHIFYLPILKEDDWRIFQYLNGNEQTLTLNMFVAFCKTA